MRNGVTRKRSTKRLRHTENLFRKNPVKQVKISATSQVQSCLYHTVRFDYSTVRRKKVKR